MIQNQTNNGNEGQITRQLGEFAATVDYEDLSPGVVVGVFAAVTPRNAPSERSSAGGT